MRTRASLWVRVSAIALLVLASVMVARSAVAGTLEIRDDRGTLSPGDTARLRSVIQSATFDARLAITSDYADARELSRYVGSLLNSGNMIAVGLDTQHRHVQIHFGSASGIPQSAWGDVERAGNDSFRRGDWTQGVESILRSAMASTRALPGQAPVARPSIVGPVFGLLVAAGVIGLLIYLARRSRSYGNYDGGYGTPVDPRYGPQPWGGPGGSYGPGAGGMGPLGGGIIGAGLGGLAGYELGKMEGERERSLEERRHGGGGFDDSGNFDDRGGFDAGGGGSSWGDGGSGGSDGGGGFDGGGGSDGGGGGSDF